MKEVSIYTATSIKGRWNKDGLIGYTLEYYPENSKYSKTLTDYETVQQLNENQAEIEALIHAMRRMREKCILTIYTESDYIYKALEDHGYIEKWIRAGWITAKGQEVKNKEKWQQLMKLLQGNMYHVLYKRNNAYTGILVEEMQRKVG